MEALSHRGKLVFVARGRSRKGSAPDSLVDHSALASDGPRLSVRAETASRTLLPVAHASTRTRAAQLR